MRPVMLHLLLLAAIASAIFFTNLGTARLWDRDEPRNAGCAAEMMSRGDWIVPTFNDELRHQKPVLLYWLIMSAYTVLGVNEWGARFWSALLAVVTVLATYDIARRLAQVSYSKQNSIVGSSPELIGLFAGIMLATSLMFGVAARAATPDSVLIVCSTGAIWIYVASTFRSGQVLDWFPKNYSIVLAFYGVLGLGVLAKGPIGFLLPMAVIGWFLLVVTNTAASSSVANENQTNFLVRFVCRIKLAVIHFLKTLWRMRPITGAIMVLLMAAPWYVLVHIQTDGDFTRLFFVGEHFGRATNPMENHSGGLWFYPLAILVGFFPWSMFWGPVVIALWNHRRSGNRLAPLEVFCLIWVLLQVGVFSLAQTKLPSYVTPCYPALAILTAGCLVRWTRYESTLNSRWLVLALGALSFGGIVIVAGLGYAAVEFFPQQKWLCLLGLVPLLGGAVAIYQTFREQRQRVLLTMIGSSILFVWLLFGFGTVAIDSVQQQQFVLEPIANSDDEPLVAAYRTLESSWVFYSERPIYECSVEPVSEAAASPLLPTLERSKPWQPKPRLSPEALVQIQPNTVFITADEHLAELQSRLPADFEVCRTAAYFLKKNKFLVTVQRRRAGVAWTPKTWR